MGSVRPARGWLSVKGSSDPAIGITGGPREGGAAVVFTGRGGFSEVLRGCLIAGRFGFGEFAPLAL